MKILVTGARGFIGRNLCEVLYNIRDGKDRRPEYSCLMPLTVFEYDRESSEEDLDAYCKAADFVFNLAGVNRPKDPAEFIEGNFGFAEHLLNTLEKYNNACPVMLSSSAQASLEGRYAGSAYGESKLAGEDLFRRYSAKTGASVFIYRFPNVYGKWCHPNYNSAIATFCNNIAHGLPITVNDPNVELEVLYIDDLVSAMLDLLVKCQEKKDVPQYSDAILTVSQTDNVTLGEIVSLLESYHDSRETLIIPPMEEGSFEKKLFSTYMSYFDESNIAYALKTNVDERGSFSEFLKTPQGGQISINVTAPKKTKGNHWHNSKWEKFLVVSGEGLIRLRKIGEDSEGNPNPVIEYQVCGDNYTVIETPPGFTHSIVNTSDTEDLISIIWVNEFFDPNNPDTFFEEV